MRMNSDPERDDTLLDAMLRDENWQTASAAFKARRLEHSAPGSAFAG